jgi:hypothetical protein
MTQRTQIKYTVRTAGMKKGDGWMRARGLIHGDGEGVAGGSVCEDGEVRCMARFGSWSGGHNRAPARLEGGVFLGFGKKLRGKMHKMGAGRR